MKRLLLVLICLFISTSALCYPLKHLAFECESKDSVWRVEREKGKDPFAFFHEERLVAHRHLDWVENGLLTNGYDLDLKLSKLGEGWQGHLKGVLLGKLRDVTGLVCIGDPESND